MASPSAGATGSTGRSLRAGIASLGPGTVGPQLRRASSTSARQDTDPRHQGLLPRRGVYDVARPGAVLLHDGVHGHHRHDPDRRDGRTLGMEELRALRPVGRAAVLHLRATGSGAAAGSRRLGINWRPGPRRRWTSPAPASCTRWAASSRLAGAIMHRAAHRQVRRRQAASHPRPQHSDGDARHVHPRLRLVRLQSRLDAGGHRSAHQLRRRQHDARERRRRVRDHGLPDAQAA